MRHVPDGTLHAYLDGALPTEVSERLRDHLQHCSRCAQRLACLEARSRRIQLLCQSLSVQDDTQPGTADTSASTISSRVARRRLEAYAYSREGVGTPMSNLKQWFTRRTSPAWVVVVLVVVLGLSLTLAPVRAFAGNLLALFRVQKIEVVEFSPSALFTEQGAEAAMRSLENVMDEQVTVEVAGEPTEVDEETLRSLSSIPVRLPQDVQGEAHYRLQPGAHVAVQVDLARIRALLTELGYEDVSLPDDLDGANIDVQLAPMAVAVYGGCEPDTEAWPETHGPSDSGGERIQGDCTVLAQMRSPVVSAPDDLDVQQLGRAYLQLLGMSADEAASFSSKIDWAATLVIPLPRSEARYEEPTVDGVPAVLIRPTQHRQPQSEYVLMWVKQDIVYTLMGTGGRAKAMQVANSLQ